MYKFTRKITHIYLLPTIYRPTNFYELMQPLQTIFHLLFMIP